MTNEVEQIVLDILKDVLNNEFEHSDVNIVDWPTVYEEFRTQSLLPLTYPWIKKYGIRNSEIADKWTNSFVTQSFMWYKAMDEQKKLIDLLSSNGHPIVIMKGIANSVYFPNPQLRVSSDVDFLVRWDEYDQVFEFLLQSGYTLVGEKKESKHHVVLAKNNIVFEMHKRPGGTRITGKYADQEMVDFFQKGLEERVTVTCLQYEIPVFPAIHTAMVLLLHTAQHMREGIGLRHVLDWMMFVKENVDDQFWDSELQHRAQLGNVETLAKVMTKMCKRHLGLTSSITWCDSADDKACDQLLEYVFCQGDFGAKAGSKDAEVRLLAESRNVSSFMKRLYRSSLYSMPAAKRSIVLRPVAVIYQLFRYAKKWVTRSHPFESFYMSKVEGDARADLFKKLGIRLD